MGGVSRDYDDHGVGEGGAVTDRRGCTTVGKVGDDEYQDVEETTVMKKQHEVEERVGSGGEPVDEGEEHDEKDLGRRHVKWRRISSERFG